MSSALGSRYFDLSPVTADLVRWVQVKCSNSYRRILMTQVAHIFLDTNCALHFVRPDHIDWCALAKSDEAILVCAPIFFEEIEQQKVKNNSRKLRDRASEFIKWIAPFIREGNSKVRANTTWRFIAEEPNVDFASHKLAREIADDHLIASLINYPVSSSDTKFVATGDLGLEVKLRNRGINVLLLPESARLPDEPDALEREVVELRRKLHLQREPVLGLTFGNEETRSAVELKRPTAGAAVLSLESVRREHPRISETASEEPDNNNSLASQILRSRDLLERTWVSPERIKLYNDNLDAFFAAYEKFLSELSRWRESMALTFEASLVLSNSGTAPATDIDITVVFPEELALIEEAELPPRPEQPQAPRRPSFASSFESPLFSRRGLDVFPSLSYLHTSKTESVLRIDNERHEARSWLDGVKHGIARKMETFYVRYPASGALKSFHVDYEISAAEMPESAAGQLHFIYDS